MSTNPRRKRPHPARRARRVAGALSVSSLLALTGCMAANGKTSTGTQSGGSASATAATSSSGSSGATSVATRSTTVTAVAATASGASNTSTHGS